MRLPDVAFWSFDKGVKLGVSWDTIRGLWRNICSAASLGTICSVFCLASCMNVRTPAGAVIQSLGGKIAFQHGADGSESLVSDHDAAFAAGVTAASDLATASIVNSATKFVTNSNNGVKINATNNATAQALAKEKATADAAATKLAGQTATTTEAIKAGAPLAPVTVNPP